MQQSEALSILKMGMNVFLTGAAGSGKTYLLNQYIQHLKRNYVETAVTASTGIAATHLQGVTIHSWSGIGVKDSLTKRDLEKFLEPKEKRIKRNYLKTHVLIIDEISMLHPHQLDMVDTIARFIRRSDDAFGGMQVVLCGDFFQLPPVSRRVDLDQEKQFAYEAKSWEAGEFRICYLDEQHRQGDDALLTVLNDIRNGTAGEQTKVSLRTRYKKEPQGAVKATKLYSRNVNVDVMNQQALDVLPGQEKIFFMTSDGFVPALIQGLKKNCLAPEKLALKTGAEVMFVKNHPMNRYTNGTRSIVVGFDKQEGWPVVKTYDNAIITVTPDEWTYEENGMVRARIQQLPLRLAWAITIHKSQGMTLDAAEIDLGDAFEPGMGYVALSRVRSLSGLKLMNLNEIALKVHPDVLQYDKQLKATSLNVVEFLKSLSEKEILSRIEATLLQRFKGSENPVPKKASRVKKQKPEKILTHIVTLDMLKEKLSIESIASKRGLAKVTIVNHIEKILNLKLAEKAELAHLRDNIPSKAFEVIADAFKKSEDGKLKPIFEAFQGKYSYDDIHVVRLLI